MKYTANEIIDCVAAIRGSKKKVEYLQSILADQDYADGMETLREVVEYALDDMLSFHITALPNWSPGILDGVGIPASLRDGIEFLRKLNDKGSANRTDKETLGRLAYYMSKDDRELLDYIVERDLRCGLGISSFRKIWGKGFVPEMEVALCAAFSEKAVLEHIDFKAGAHSQLKSDGVRCIVTKRGNNIAVRSRKGKPFHGLDEFIKDLEYMTDEIEGDWDLDGELLVVPDKPTDDIAGDVKVYLERKTGNGIINKASKGTISPEEASRVRLVAWDLVLRSGIGFEEPYRVRFQRLSTLVHRTPFVDKTLSKVVYSLLEAKQHFQEMVALGQEGTILKNGDGVWTPGDSDTARRQNGFKFKEEFDAEFCIVDWYKGKPKSKYENDIGGVVIESSCGRVAAHCGSGLSDEMRRGDPNELMNKIVTIRYNARITSLGRESFSLFLPRVIEVRDDKTEADDLEKIIAQEEASRALEV